MRHTDLQFAVKVGLVWTSARLVGKCLLGGTSCTEDTFVFPPPHSTSTSHSGATTQPTHPAHAPPALPSPNPVAFSTARHIPPPNDHSPPMRSPSPLLNCLAVDNLCNLFPHHARAHTTTQPPYSRTNLPLPRSPQPPLQPLSRPLHTTALSASPDSNSDAPSLTPPAIFRRADYKPCAQGHFATQTIMHTPQPPKSASRPW